MTKKLNVLFKSEEKTYQPVSESNGVVLFQNEANKEDSKSFKKEEVLQKFKEKEWEVQKGEHENQLPMERLENAKILLPDYVYNDVKQRMNDWLESGHSEEASYMYEKLRYAQRFISNI